MPSPGKQSSTASGNSQETGFVRANEHARHVLHAKQTCLRLKTGKMMDEIRLPRKASGLRQNASGEAASAALRPVRGTGSNSENNNNPAKNPPICACQATLTPS